jgi:hypothetical protein
MAENSAGSGFRFGTIVTLVPLVTAAFGGLQYYRDQQQREFQAITFYLQNQPVFDPCADAQLANLNLGMIENTYPRVYASIVDHVEARASQCDSVPVMAQEENANPAVIVAPAPSVEDAPGASETQAPATRGAARSVAPAPGEQAPTVQAPVAPPQQSQRAQVPAGTEEARAYFRNRYDRIASLPSSSARKIDAGQYRVFIQISSEASRATAGAVVENLKKAGHTAPGVELVPVKVERAELRYYRETQAADAQALADSIETMLAGAGTKTQVTPVFIGRGRPGLPPGTMELWLP